MHTYGWLKKECRNKNIRVSDLLVKVNYPKGYTTTIKLLKPDFWEKAYNELDINYAPAKKDFSKIIEKIKNDINERGYARNSTAKQCFITYDINENKEIQLIDYKFKNGINDNYYRSDKYKVSQNTLYEALEIFEYFHKKRT